MEAELKEFLSSSCSVYLKSVTACILPFVQVTAIIMNIFHVITFSKWKNPLYRYLRATATVDTIWLVLYFAFTQTICNNNPYVILNYWYRIFQLLVIYLIKVIDMASALINIQIAYDRYFILTKGYIKKKINLRLFLYFLVASVFYTPSILLIKIYKIEKCYNCTIFYANNTKHNMTQDLYFAYLSEFFQKHTSLKYILTSMNYLVALIILVVIIALNVLIYKQSKKSKEKIIFKVKMEAVDLVVGADNDLEIDADDQNPTKNLTKERVHVNDRITLMVIWISCLFVVDQLFSIIIPNLVYLAIGNSWRIYLKSFVILLFFRLISSLLNTVFYCFYYNKYRQFLKTNLLILVCVLFFLPSLVSSFFVLLKYF